MPSLCFVVRLSNQPCKFWSGFLEPLMLYLPFVTHQAWNGVALQHCPCTAFTLLNVAFRVFVSVFYQDVTMGSSILGIPPPLHHLPLHPTTDPFLVLVHFSSYILPLYTSPYSFSSSSRLRVQPRLSQSTPRSLHRES